MEPFCYREAAISTNMKIKVVLLLLLLTCLCLSTAQGSFGNCCLGYVRRIKPSTKRNIENYRMQETDGDCNIRAVVFFIKKRSGQAKPGTICAKPEDKWVQDAMTVVNARNQIVS